MTSFVDLSGLESLIARVNALGVLDAKLLMDHFMLLVEEDNRRGVLAGLDKDGKPMRPVTYRPVGPKSSRTKINSPKSAALRNAAKPRARAGVFGGFGAMAAGLNNNLTTREYQRLDGPPLAPRRQFSRVITNLRTTVEHSEGWHVWTAVGSWAAVVSTKGVPFLPAHFEGKTVGRKPGFRLHVRDLAGVRPEGLAKARKAAVAWMANEVRKAVRSA